jgi:hypothetical protein
MLMAVSDPLRRMTASEKPVHGRLDAPAREASSRLHSTDPNSLKAQLFASELGSFRKFAFHPRRRSAPTGALK